MGENGGKWGGNGQTHVLHRVLCKFKFIVPFVRPLLIEFVVLLFLA